jgi:resuscitation-promoting factor RpfB
VTTTDATVGELIDDLGITLGPNDRLSVRAASLIRAGQTITVQRVSKRVVTRTEALPFRITKQRDPTLYVGTTKIVTPGTKGSARVTYSLIYVDGKVVGKTRLRLVVLTRPKTQVERVGTKLRSTASAPSAPTPSPGTAKAIARELLTDRGWGDAQYNCLVTLWDHESGWNVHATNSSTGAYGIPQALPGSKMSTAGPDWENNATTQIKWGLGYIADRYNTPCGAWSFWQGNGWY